MSIRSSSCLTRRAGGAGCCPAFCPDTKCCTPSLGRVALAFLWGFPLLYILSVQVFDGKDPGYIQNIFGWDIEHFHVWGTGDGNPWLWWVLIFLLAFWSLAILVRACVIRSWQSIVAALGAAAAACFLFLSSLA